MPALGAIAQGLKVLLHYAAPSIPNMINRLFFQGSGSTTPAAMNTWVTNIGNAWGTNMAPHTMPGVALVAVTAEDLSSAGAATGAWAGNVAGTITGGTALPASSCVVIENVSPVRQRGGVSRTFLPGPNGQWLASPEGGIWSASAISPIVTSWGNFIKAITGGNGPAGYSDLSQGVAHYYKGNKVVLSDGTPPYQWARNSPIPITSPYINSPVAYTGSLTVGTQRRRNSE